MLVLKPVHRFTIDNHFVEEMFEVYHRKENIGFLHLSYFPDNSFPNKIEGLIIYDDFQGKGYGTTLLNTAISLLPKNNLIQLNVWKTNFIAMRLYEKAGFIIKKEQKNTFIMEKSIDK